MRDGILVAALRAATRNHERTTRDEGRHAETKSHAITSTSPR